MQARARTLSFLALWLTLAASGARADDETPLVRVGGAAVGQLEALGALQACTAHARATGAELDASACLRGPQAFAWLLDRAAARAQLSAKPELARAHNELLARALVDQLAQSVPAPTESELNAARAAAAREFDKPERLRLFRILVGTRAEAEAARARLGSGATLAAWTSLCREISLDKATHERGGDLGFVAPDGSTDVPEVSADPALYAAAQKLAEGEIAREPVAEGTRFALVWRRGSLPKTTLAPGEAETRRVDSLRRVAADSQRRTLVAELRQKGLAQYHPEALDKLRGAGRLYPAQ